MYQSATLLPRPMLCVFEIGSFKGRDGMDGRGRSARSKLPNSNSPTPHSVWPTFASLPEPKINMAPQTLSTPEEYKKLVDSVEVFLLDCDGVIYHGPVVVPGVKEVLKYLRSIGKYPVTSPRSILFAVEDDSRSGRGLMQ